jgi:putative ABC transport system substrate-binding protein
MQRREFITLLGGAVAALPLPARAQQAAQKAVSVIGILDRFGPSPKSPQLEAFRAGLADGGFIEGTNVSIEYRGGTGGNASRLTDLAADLVRRQVAVIVTLGAVAPALAAKAATSTIPIVFLYGGDPVKDSLVGTLNRPGGNITGVTTLTSELAGKRLDLLLKIVPQAKKIGFLSGTRSFFAYEEQTTAMLSAGRGLGVEMMIVECRSDNDYEAAVAKMAEGGAGGMILGSFALPNLGKVVPLAASYKLPTIYTNRGFVQTGGLMSYDTDNATLFRRLGSAYVARILKGEKPANIPVEQPTKFELVVNLNTAKALGLTVPPTLLAIADDIIE